MAPRVAVAHQVLDGVTVLLNLKKGFEWLEKKLRHICGYLQAADQLRAHDLSVKEWRQEVRDVAEHKADDFLRLLPSREEADWVKYSTKLHKIVTNGELEERVKEGEEDWNKVKANNAQVEICFWHDL